MDGGVRMRGGHPGGGVGRVRPAGPEDAGPLGTVQLACRRETYAGLLSPGLLDGQRAEDLVARWQRLLAELPGHTHLAEVDGEVVGFASTRPGEEGSPRELELWGIYVRTAHHGVGLGQVLLDAAVGAEPAFLWVAEANDRAVAFYRRNGFAPDGARQVLAGWDDLPVVRLVR